MRLLIDLLHIQFSFNTGTTNTSINTVKGFVRYSNMDVVLLVWENQEGFIDELVGFDLPKIIIPSRLKKVSRLKRGLCPSLVKEKIDNGGVDVILTACYTASSYLYPKKYHQIGVVHDIQQLKIRLQDKKWFEALYVAANMFVCYRLLGNLVTISESVKQDVKKVSCGKEATVIYNSINICDDDEQEIASVSNKPYILDVNSFFEYKNTEKLIYAFSAIKNKIPHILYLKGYKGDDVRYWALMQLVKDEGCEGRVIIDITNRSSAEMNYLYHHADLFVSPSLMEGFGLTPIEAAMHKAPVIVSDIDTLVEVTDGLVATFDPRSVASISNAIIRALDNPPSKEKLYHIAERFRQKYAIENQVRSYMTLIETWRNS